MAFLRYVIPLLVVAALMLTGIRLMYPSVEDRMTTILSLLGENQHIMIAGQKDIAQNQARILQLLENGCPIPAFPRPEDR